VEISTGLIDASTAIREHKLYDVCIYIPIDFLRDIAKAKARVADPMPITNEKQNPKTASDPNHSPESI
jgi:hypothetical protein